MRGPRRIGEHRKMDTRPISVPNRRRFRPARALALLALAAVVVSGGTALAVQIIGQGAAPSAASSLAPSSEVSEASWSPDWPASGAAAFAVGDGEIVASSNAALPMASVSKVVTALLVLEARPLEVGQQGGDYWFTEQWNREYEEYLARGESALKVPVDGMLTQHQLLQGMLIGSACNYADILVESIWGDQAAFATAAAEYLEDRGIDGITMVEATGIDPRNTATATALIEVGRLALAHPVIAEIVATAEVDLPGAGRVENTNELLADPGVVGLKTGTLDGSNLLSAKEIPAGGETARVWAVVLGQPDDEARFSASRELYASIERGIAG